MRAQINNKAKRKVIHEGRFLRFVRKGEWEYTQRNNCNAIVIIAALTEDEHVIFVEQYRLPVDRIVIEFPAGLVNDRGQKKLESVLSAAKREFLEETGYQAKKWVKILDGPVSSGSSADLITLFLAYDARKIAEGGGDDLESITVHSIPIERVDQWLTKMKSKGRLVEPKIYTGLYFLKTYNRGS
jgi:ADP-ribose pyrophosphatase